MGSLPEMIGIRLHNGILTLRDAKTIDSPSFLLTFPGTFRNSSWGFQQGTMRNSAGPQAKVFKTPQELYLTGR